MYKIMLALHIVFVVVAIGPLVHAAVTAGRGVKTADGPAVEGSLRWLRLYSIASVLVVIFGFALMSADSPYGPGHKVGEFKQTYIWLSLILWAVAVGIVHALVIPTLQKVSEKLRNGGSATSYTAKVAATGGLVGVIFIVIVFLMVYRPGA